MCELILFLFASLRSWFYSRIRLHPEIVALRHQIILLRRGQRGRIRLRASDRFFWVWLSRWWSGWRSALAIVKYVFIALAHDRRRLLHFNVTAHPTAEWTAKQMVEAFPWDKAPRYLLHDRDSIYEGSFRQRVRGMGIREVLTAPRSPWQNPQAERLVGSIRRECLDHVVVFNEASLRGILQSYCMYYLKARTHLALSKDTPEPRAIQPPELGVVVEYPEVGGLHHRYERRAA